MLSKELRVSMAMPSGCRLALCAVGLSCFLTIANAPDPQSFDQRLLAAHNAAREHLGIAPLQWDSGLAAAAANRANQLAVSHVFQHAPDNAMSPQGENIWGGTKGYYSPEDMVNAWADEKQYFKPGIFPQNSTTGKIEDVGHFTQLAWKDTTKVGCAVAEDAEYDILVCRYSPAGNYDGERPF